MPYGLNRGSPACLIEKLTMARKYTMTEEHKKQISMACSGDKNPAKRPEVREKISKIIRENHIGRRFEKGNIPWNKGLSTKKEIKIHKTRVAWNKGMKGIHLSPNTEFKKGQVNLFREKNSNWQGGISFEPYTPEFNVLFKEAIRTRDAFLCLKCGMREEDSRVLFKKRLHVHHINYEKKLTIPENCCALCQRCNIEVNQNRTHWTKFFQSLLSERYGYDYSENGSVILNVEIIE